MMKKPEVKNNKNGQNGKKKGPHKKQGGQAAKEGMPIV
jgi:hypothetical protein